MEEKSTYIGYEYKEILTGSEKKQFLIDGYKNFGWEMTESSLKRSEIPSQYANKEKIHFRRNRNIINKAELTRLQRNFEACINEIDRLERRKFSKGTMFALIIAFLGTVFLAASVFAVTAAVPNIFLTIIFGIPGVVGWIIPYFVYKKIVHKEIKRLTPIIERKYDEIYEICEKGHRLCYEEE